MKVGLATVSWRGPGSVLEPGKVSREVKWSGMGLGWCAVFHVIGRMPVAYRGIDERVDVY